MAGSDGRSEKEKMLAGELYRAVGPELAAAGPALSRMGLSSTLPRATSEIQARLAVNDPAPCSGDGPAVVRSDAWSTIDPKALFTLPKN